MNEMETAYLHLTAQQSRDVKHLYVVKGLGISAIACKLSLTRYYVQSYVRRLNSAVQQ